jgi:4-hydroxybenzoate polyprenyltransferase
MNSMLYLYLYMQKLKSYTVVDVLFLFLLFQSVPFLLRFAATRRLPHTDDHAIMFTATCAQPGQPPAQGT